MDQIWSNLVTGAGNVGVSLLSNKGKEIEGKYQTELQALYNQRDLSKAQFETELAKINANRASDLQTLSNERTKSTAIVIGIVVVALGTLAAVTVWALRRK